MVQTVATRPPPPFGQIAAGAPVALFLDFDGTLIDIAPSPDAILVPQDMAARLEMLAKKLEGRLALVSGRSVSDIIRHLGPLELALAGSHGEERMLPDGSPLGPSPAFLPDEATDAMRAYADSHEGLAYEAKSYGAALHYRAVPGSEEQVVAYAETIAETYGLTLKRGKCVAEVVRGGAGKAGAVHAFMEQPPFAGAMPVFIGDDITDEDGFSAVNDLGGFGVVVGDRLATAARYRLSTPAKVHEWIEL